MPGAGSVGHRGGGGLAGGAGDRLEQAHPSRELIRITSTTVTTSSAAVAVIPPVSAACSEAAVARAAEEVPGAAAAAFSAAAPDPAPVPAPRAETRPEATVTVVTSRIDSSKPPLFQASTAEARPRVSAGSVTATLSSRPISITALAASIAGSGLRSQLPSACITAPRSVSSSPAACSGPRTSTTTPTSSSRGTDAPESAAATPSAPVTAPASAAAATTTAPIATPQGPSDLSSGRRHRAVTDQAVPSGRQPPKRTPMIPAGSHIAPIARASVTSNALVGSPLVTPMATFTPGASASARIVSTSTTEISTT